uniref:Uncharacterized protein n=1 Tax=Arundo donax TaxID=35708 RepID=A0A0A8ZYL1_ARUDO
MNLVHKTSSTLSKVPGENDWVLLFWSLASSELNSVGHGMVHIMVKGWGELWGPEGI